MKTDTTRTRHHWTERSDGALLCAVAELLPMKTKHRHERYWDLGAAATHAHVGGGNITGKAAEHRARTVRKRNAAEAAPPGEKKTTAAVNMVPIQVRLERIQKSQDDLAERIEHLIDHLTAP